MSDCGTREPAYAVRQDVHAAPCYPANDVVKDLEEIAFNTRENGTGSGLVKQLKKTNPSTLKRSV